MLSLSRRWLAIANTITSAQMRIGTIKQIWRYPVKSMAGERLEACTVGMRGIPGDRGWAIRDEDTGKLISGSRLPLLMQCAARYREPPVNGFVPHVEMQLPDGRTLGSDLPGIDERLSELLKMPVLLSALHFDEQRETYFDDTPIHVLTTASLDVMQRSNPNADWDVRRFRPNFLVETDPDITGLLEAEWTNRKLRLGEVELYCKIPTVRCSMTIQAQSEFGKDPSILKTIVREAAENLGVYANVISTGDVRVGDPVEIN